jgi:hypothetical protein
MGEHSAGQLEAALRFMYRAEQRPRAFLAKLDGLKRQNVLGIKTKRGPAPRYGRLEAVRLGLAVELSEFHLPPAVIAALFDKRWSPADPSRPFDPERESDVTSISEAVALAAHRNAKGKPNPKLDVLMTIEPAGVAASDWRGDGGKQIPSIGIVAGERAAVGFYHSLGGERRALIFNLSRWLRDFDHALEQATVEPKEPTDPIARAILAAGRARRGE